MRRFWYVLALLYAATFAFALTISSKAFSSSLDIEQMSKDVHFLASDKLAGRAAFTPEIDQAADYIAKRFSAIGLQPLTNEKSFKQTFDIFRVSTDALTLKLNGKTIANESIISLTSFERIDWSNKTTIETITISKDEDFRKAMSSVNQKRADILVLVDKAHQEIFARYHKFFSRGVTKFSINEGPSALIILTDEKKVNELSFQRTSKVTTQQLTNVIGTIPGKDKKEEFVLFTAHYDHIGIKLDLPGDKIYNGANDNATGTTAVISLAEYFVAQNTNQRTLVFAAFTAEEIGGYGSKYFSTQLAPEKITAMVNIEMIGQPSKFGPGQVWMTGYDRSNLAILLNKRYGSNKIKADPYPKQNLFYRSDNATLAKLGVPAHSFSSSQIDIDKHYHQVTDEADTLDLKSMYQVIEALAKASQGLVDGSDTPTRVDTSQVKPSGSFY